MKTVYTVEYRIRKRHGRIPYQFVNHSSAVNAAEWLARLFHVNTWTAINNIYTDAEVAEIKRAYQEAQQHPLDEGDSKAWHWKA